MMRSLAILTIVMGFCAATYAQNANSGGSMTTSCTFDDGQQVSVRFNNTGKSDEPRNGKPWRPGNAPMVLFTQTALRLNNVDIAPGAYNLWIIPDKKSWSLAVNKDVTANSQYSAGQDLVRIPMELGQLGSPAQQPDLGFAHMSAKECSLRIYYGKVGAFAEMYEK